MWKLLKDLDTHRDLLAIMVGRNLKIRYKRSVLGFLWSLLNPLFFILIYAIFLKILKCYKAGDQLFMPMLVTGVITWQFLATSLTDSLGVIVGNSNLVARAVFPRIVLPLASTIGNLVNFLFSMVILMSYVLLLRIGQYSPIEFDCLGILPLTIMTHFALCLGLGLILSALNVFFRDIEHILSVGLLAWFFLTPVIYYLQDIPVEYQRLAFLNPMTGIVTAYRSACLGVGVMAPRLVMMSFGIAWGICFIGIAFFQRVQARFVDEF